MSATVLRELVAKIGFAVDESGFKKAEADIDAIKASLNELDKSTGKSAAKVASAGKAMAGATGAAKTGARSAAAPRGAERIASRRAERSADGAASVTAGRRRDARGKFVKKGGGDGGTSDTAEKAGAGLSGLTKLLGGLAIGAALKGMVELASDANETQNVLKEVFGDQGKEQVNAWADSAAKAMGRSTYQLRENAGALGAMIEPMVGSAAKAQEMSTRFAGLAVDLGSFFNATDEEALAALKSGITGEAEPLKKFGVVMNEATLAEYAHSQGISKKLAAMSNAEKTELRYGFILAKTTKAAGDAARTQTGFANSSKALQARVRDAATTMGQKLLPVAGKLIKWGSDAVGIFLEVAQNSSILEAALIVLAGAFGIMQAEAAGAWLAAVIVPVAALAAMALLLDDIYQLFTGGESAIGQWLDTVFGIGTANTVVQAFNDALTFVVETSKALAEAWALLPDMAGMFDLVTGAAENFGSSVMEIFIRLGDKVTEFIEKISNLGNAFARLLGFDVTDDQASAKGRASGRGLGAGVMTAEQESDTRARELGARVKTDYEARKATAAEIASRSYASGRGTGAGTQAFGVANVATAPATVSAAVPGAGVPPAAAAAATTVNNGPVTVNIAAGTGAADAGRAAKAAIEAERRRTKEAITRSG